MNRTLIVAVIVAVALVGARGTTGKEVYYVSDAKGIVAVDKTDGSSMLLPIPDNPPGLTVEGLKYGWTTIAVSPKTHKLYAINTRRQLVEFDQDSTPFGVRVVAGKAGRIDVSGKTKPAEGTGTNAVFGGAFSLTFLSNGDMAVVDRLDTVLRKVTVDGVVTAYGTRGAAGSGLPMYEPIVGVADANDNVYVGCRTDIIKVSPSGTYTRVAGVQSTPKNQQDPKAKTALADGGLGTSRVFKVSGLAMSPDQTKLYFSSVIDSGNGKKGVQDGTSSLIRVLDVATNTVTTLAGSASHAVGSYADGVGTSAVIHFISQFAFDSDANLVFTEMCAKGSVVRKFNPSTNEVTRVAGSYTKAGCGAYVDVASTLSSTVVGDKDTLGLVFASGLSAVNLVCARAFPIGVDVDLSGVSCKTLDGGSVPKLEVTTTSNMKVTAPMVVEGAVTLGAASVLEVAAALDIKGPLAIDNATLAISGFPATADTLAMTTSTVYQITLDSTSPPILTITNDAAISGTIIVVVAPDFDFGVGASAPVLNFDVHEGTFLEVFFVKLRGRSAASRSLLQGGAANAQVACGSSSCVATGVALSGGDDDDEVPIIVALIVVSVALFAFLVAAVIVSARRRRRSGGDGRQQRLAPSASSSSSSSSSSFSSDYGYDF